jgi:hypothetical protein
MERTRLDARFEKLFLIGKNGAPKGTISELFSPISWQA